MWYMLVFVTWLWGRREPSELLLCSWLCSCLRRLYTAVHCSPRGQRPHTQQDWHSSCPKHGSSCGLTRLKIIKKRMYISIQVFMVLYKCVQFECVLFVARVDFMDKDISSETHGSIYIIFVHNLCHFTIKDWYMNFS